MYRKTYVNIDVNNLQSNVKNIINKYPEYKWYIGVVKGNAYGHGMECAKYLTQAGINFFAVSSLEEALELRKIVPDVGILCLEPIDVENLEICVKENISITVHSIEYLNELMNLKLNLDNKLKVHIKLDTGLNRLGFKYKEEADKAYKYFKQNSSYILEGVYSHFGTLGIWDKAWDNQLSSFNDLTNGWSIQDIPMVHFARSATIINHKKIEGTNGVRLGISMYGYVNKFTDKGNNIKQRFRYLKLKLRNKKLNVSDRILDDVPEVTQVLSMYSHILQTKHMIAGESTGYAEEFVANEDTYVATIPVGYADGFSTSNVGRYVYLNGKKQKIVSVNMCLTTIKVDETCKAGDMVELLGQNISAEYVARHLGINRYILVTTISNSVPRVYINNGGVLNEK